MNQSTTTPSSSAEKSRARACEPCRKRKARCDLARPHCGGCLKAGRSHLCVYAGLPPTQGVIGGRRVQELEAKVAAMEKLISNIAFSTIKGFQKEDVLVAGEKDLGAQFQWVLVDATQGNDANPIVANPSLIFGASASPTSTLSAVTQQSLSNQIPESRQPWAHLCTQLPGSPSPVGSSWWDQEVNQDDPYSLLLVHTFLAQSQAQFPLDMVDRKMLLYSPESILPILRLGIQACGARLSPITLTGSTTSMLDRSEDLFQRARSHVSQYFDHPHIQAVQALLIMVMCSAAANRNSSASMYLGMLTRMALVLKLNTDPDVIEQSQLRSCPGSARRWTWREKETWRRTWWAAFTLDRMVAGITNRRPILETCDENAVMLPDPSLEWESLAPPCKEEYATTSPAAKMSKVVKHPNYFRHFVAILGLYYEVVVFSRSPTASVPDPSVADPVLAMEKKIGDWFRGLPEEIQTIMATINEKTEFSNSLAHGIPWLCVVMLLAYHGCFCILHRSRLLLGVGAQSLLSSLTPRPMDMGENSEHTYNDKSSPDSTISTGSSNNTSNGSTTIAKELSDFPNLSLKDLGKSLQDIKLPMNYPSPRDSDTDENLAIFTTDATTSTLFTKAKLEPVEMAAAAAIASTGNPGEDQVGKTVSAAIHYSVTQASYSATSIAHLIQTVAAKNPKFLNLSSHCCLSITESTVVLALLVNLHVEMGSAADLEFALELRRLIDGNMYALQAFATTFSTIKYSLVGVNIMMQAVPSYEQLLLKQNRL